MTTNETTVDTLAAGPESATVCLFHLCPETGLSPGRGGMDHSVANVLRRLLTALSMATFVGFTALFVRDLVSGGIGGFLPRGLALVILGAAALLLFVRDDWKLSRLRVVELVVFTTLALYLGVRTYSQELVDLSVPGAIDTAGWSSMLLRFALLMVAYGVFVPNKPVRAAFVVGSIALTPMLAVLLIRVFHPDLRAAVDSAASTQAFETFLLLGVSTAVATLAAFLIYKYFSMAYDSRRATFYDLEKLIGTGGMGEVWKASHRALARPAAVKLIREDRIGDADANTVKRVLLRFEREAKATASLRSPHTVEVYDAGITADGHFYYAMEYLEGFDLETLVDNFGPVPAERVIHFLTQACDSLADAHGSGLTHRDIKPANLHVSHRGPSRDHIKLLDFGIVKTEGPVEENAKLTADGTTTGTAAYMAPEMTVSDVVDGRADIYALGCVAYWLLTGKLVFEAANSVALIVEHVNTVPTPPSERAELEIPAELDAIIMKCLEKDPAARFQAAGELADALESVQTKTRWSSKRAGEWWDLHWAEPAAA